MTARPSTAEERLGDSDRGGGRGEGIELALRAVDDLRVVVDGGGDLRAWAEALEIGKVGGYVGEGRGLGWGRAAAVTGASGSCRGGGVAGEGDGVRTAKVAGGEDELRVEERNVRLGVGNKAGGVEREVVDGGVGGVEGGEIGDGGRVVGLGELAVLLRSGEPGPPTPLGLSLMV